VVVVEKGWVVDVDKVVVVFVRGKQGLEGNVGDGKMPMCVRSWCNGCAGMIFAMARVGVDAGLLVEVV
jgi:hypothetical protein